MKRTGPPLSLVERTTAVLRALDGEDHAALATEYRVRVQIIQKWIDDWTVRTGCWRDEPLLPIEIAAGCVLGEPDPSSGVNAYGSPMRYLPTTRTAKPDPNASEAVAAAARAWFLKLLQRDPPESLEQIERAWLALADHDRAVLVAAWDTYLEAAQVRDEARKRVKRATELAAMECAP